MKKLIYPQFIGRLGNNMFQIAACIGYAKKHNVGWGIKKGYIERGFGVNQVDKYFPHLPECEDHFKRYSEHQPGHDHDWFDYHEIPFHPKGVQIVGFFQSLKYFENAQEEVVKAFNLKYVSGYKDYVSIHVRRGDYVQHAESFPPVTEEYVLNALSIDELPHDIKPIFFSDDIEWCRWKFNKIPNAVFSEGRNEYEDLCLMASCGHNIIANSTFSWWGAFLNRNPNKIVISPSVEKGNWFGHSSGVQQAPKDLIPDSWIQIKFR
jgi:hypothetical protein